ncbi:MAG: type VI secretion system baseplate subunit TssK [Planctomycetes bacterium]|nr:type VI secretion system baseplate subunit TssK [Planctomycetota bacterium]
MSRIQRVLWHEGMLLLPQHFQQADRHLDARVGAALALSQRHPTGFTRLVIDNEALANQQLKLIEAAGILPDGLPFDIPAGDGAPAARPITLGPTQERLLVYLAAALERPGEINSSEDGRRDGRTMRYRAQELTVVDDSGEGERQQIQVAARHLVLVTGDETLDGLSVMPIGEIERGPSGKLVLSPHLVPPCLTVDASPVLVGLLKRTLEIVGSRAQELAHNRRQRTQGKVEFSVSESANFMMLHTLNGALPVLSHLAAGRTHPETLYTELARLAGQLATFSADGYPRDLPKYEHQDLAGCFGKLDERLRALLETSITMRYVPVPLSKTSERIHSGRVPEAVLDGHRIYFSVQCGLPAERVMKELPIKAKVASGGRLPGLIAQAMRGLSLTCLAVPPGEIPAQPGCSYFELSREGDHWDGITDTRTLGVFLPPEFTDLKLECMAVKDT